MNEASNFPAGEENIDDIIDCVAIHEVVDEEYTDIFGEEPTDQQAIEFLQDKLEEEQNEDIDY